MKIEELLHNKALKAKEKTELISRCLIDGSVRLDELLPLVCLSNSPIKAICIEAIEYATKQNSQISTLELLIFSTQMLKEKAPRVKWESARVIGNIAHIYSNQLEQTIANLLINAEHKGTVVRWSTAFALGEILKLKTKQHQELLLALENICESEEKNSIKKIYYAALKKIK